MLESLQVHDDKGYKRLQTLKRGKVHIASHIDGNMYAIKSYDLTKLDTKSQQQVLNQAIILTQLKHPNIIGLKEAYLKYKDNHTYLRIVMEYADGGDLQELLVKQELNSQEALNYFHQICLAIQYLHSKNILHRDIKPSHILFHKGTLKLGGFGLAKVEDDALLSKTIETPYQSPEMMEGESYSKESDIWSLGIILYELCTGSIPGKGQQKRQLEPYIEEFLSQILINNPHKRLSIDQILRSSIIPIPIHGDKNYKKVRDLPRGAFGKVFLAIDQSDQQMYVVKTINLTNLNMKDRLLMIQEGRIIESLDHQNIIKIKEMYKKIKDDKEHLRLVLEYADDGDLLDKIQQAKYKNKPITQEQIVSYFYQIACALQHIHKHNIIHRDLKPSNIFLTSQGIIKLGDFGVSRLMNEVNDIFQTDAGTTIYQSPEQQSGEGYALPTDIYSLGIILYEMLTLKSITSFRTIDYSSIPQEFKGILKEMLTLDQYERINIEGVIQKLQSQFNIQDLDQNKQKIEYLPKDQVEEVLQSKQRQSINIQEQPVYIPKLPTDIIKQEEKKVQIIKVKQNIGPNYYDVMAELQNKIKLNVDEQNFNEALPLLQKAIQFKETKQQYDNNQITYEQCLKILSQ